MLDGRSRLWAANPLVFSLDGFAPVRECERLVSLARGRLTRARIAHGAQGLYDSGLRTNSGHWLNPDADPDAGALCTRIAALLNLSERQSEWVHVLHYAPGEEFRPHHDGFDLSGPRAAKTALSGGQRLFTAILYLNAVEEGGATAFPELGLRISPEPGRLLVFANCLAGSNERSPMALHAGEPVIRGEKWAATTWWREHAA